MKTLRMLCFLVLAIAETNQAHMAAIVDITTNTETIQQSVEDRTLTRELQKQEQDKGQADDLSKEEIKDADWFKKQEDNDRQMFEDQRKSFKEQEDQPNEIKEKRYPRHLNKRDWYDSCTETPSEEVTHGDLPNNDTGSVTVITVIVGIVLVTVVAVTTLAIFLFVRCCRRRYKSGGTRGRVIFPPPNVVSFENWVNTDPTIQPSNEQLSSSTVSTSISSRQRMYNRRKRSGTRHITFPTVQNCENPSSTHAVEDTAQYRCSRSTTTPEYDRKGRRVWTDIWKTTIPVRNKSNKQSSVDGKDTILPIDSGQRENGPCGQKPDIQQAEFTSTDQDPIVCSASSPEPSENDPSAKNTINESTTSTGEDTTTTSTLSRGDGRIVWSKTWKRRLPTGQQSDIQSHASGGRNTLELAGRKSVQQMTTFDGSDAKLASITTGQRLNGRHVLSRVSEKAIQIEQKTDTQPSTSRGQKADKCLVWQISSVKEIPIDQPLDRQLATSDGQDKDEVLEKDASFQETEDAEASHGQKKRVRRILSVISMAMVPAGPDSDKTRLITVKKTKLL